jgi:hypothetical protein
MAIGQYTFAQPKKNTKFNNNNNILNAEYGLAEHIPVSS